MPRREVFVRDGALLQPAARRQPQDLVLDVPFVAAIAEMSRTDASRCAVLNVSSAGLHPAGAGRAVAWEAMVADGAALGLPMGVGAASHRTLRHRGSRTKQGVNPSQLEQVWSTCAYVHRTHQREICYGGGEVQVPVGKRENRRSQLVQEMRLNNGTAAAARPRGESEAVEGEKRGLAAPRCAPSY